jgi:phosphoglycolate phosphatase
MSVNLPYKLLVFDWDGTLMDSEARIVSCLAMTLQDLEVALPPRAALLDVIGLGLPEVARVLVPGGNGEQWRRFIDRYRYHFLSDHYAPSVLFAGALETLRALDGQGYLLGVATGKARRGLDRVLDETDCRGLFAVTRCADETASKPDPRMLLEVMDVAGVMPHETLMIGDTVYDMQMARNAGVAAVAVSYGVHERERLLAEEPVACLDDVAHLLPWLRDGILPAVRNAR